MSRYFKNSCQYGPTNTFIMSSPVGNLELTCCPKGIHWLKQMDKNDEHFNPDKRVNVEVISQTYQDNGYTYKPAVLCLEWLKNYFDFKQLPAPPICSSVGKSGSFTQNVWVVLQDKVTFGQTVSYSGLASLCGNVKASRAVGAAMRNNPISLIIPCHRVIQQSGSLGNYSGGTKNKMKVWLLEHEGVVK